MISIHMQITSITDANAEQDHRGWIELLSISHSVTNHGMPAEHGAATAESGGRQGGNSECSIRKSVDAASPKLYQMCATADTIDQVTIKIMRASGGDADDYLTIKFGEVVISRVSLSGGQDTGIRDMSEVVDFRYGKIEWDYAPPKYDKDKEGGHIKSGFTLTTMKPV